MDDKHKKGLRPGLLLLSTLIILTASALVYARVFIEIPLSVGAASGAGTGSGSTPSAGLNLSLTMIAILAGLGVVISLSLFGIQRQASKHANNARGGRGQSSTASMSAPSREPSDLQSLSRSTQAEEHLEAPPSKAERRSVDEILQSLRKQREDGGENTDGASTGSSQ